MSDDEYLETAQQAAREERCEGHFTALLAKLGIDADSCDAENLAMIKAVFRQGYGLGVVDGLTEGEAVAQRVLTAAIERMQ